MTGRAAADTIDDELRHWRQGDVSLDAEQEFVHVADLSCPHSPASIQAVAGADDKRKVTGIGTVAEEVEGVVILTQTCDVVRSYENRPFVEVAPLVRLDDAMVEQVRRLQRPAFAYVKCMARERLVADLDRVMTVEKAVVASWTRISGWNTDAEGREFARAIARKRSRFAFPNDFVFAAARFRRRVMDKHNRNTVEGSHLRALSEIRIRGEPSWSDDVVDLTIWFIKERDPTNVDPDWANVTSQWSTLIDESGRFRVRNAIACELDDITAREYVESDVLDLDSLSVDEIWD
ncbi:MAG: hypothetical protein OXF31_09590 [Gammaproteobacteria bacterium]|nr:hypothetical protein [Gammaproteobacteria bacterium]